MSAAPIAGVKKPITEVERQITGSEKSQTAVGRGINLLTAHAVSREYCSTYKLFNMEKLEVHSMPEKITVVDVLSENSKLELSKSLSVSVGVEAQYMGFSAAVDTNYSSSSDTSKEKSYLMVMTKVKKRRHFFHDDSFKDQLYAPFQADLDGTMKAADLFKKYGTHVIREAGMGGVLTMSMTTTKEKNESKESITVKARAAFKIYGNVNSSVEQKKSASRFMERCEFKYDAIGGTGLASLSEENLFTEYPAWVASVNDDPSTWEFSYLPNSDNGLIPIWTLAATEARRNELQKEYERQAALSRSKLAAVTKYVSTIQINNSSSKANARTAPAHWQLVDQDLNEGAKGNWIYLCYRAEDKGSLEARHAKPITNLLMVQSSKALTWTTKSLTDGAGKSAVYTRIDSDLNKNAGGQFIYLCYTTSEDYAPLTAIEAYKDNNRPTSNEWDTVTWNGTHAIADVNKGARGRYIYILQKHET